ncbi:MAG: hypothetical protein J6O49_03130, partial [Bacteroidaceae bacterium]|nr:hypothetical protein [Bacteroidaceae bacterium]
LVVEDYGFYGDDPRDGYIPSDEIDASCHSKVHFARSSREAAEQKLRELVEFEEDDWDVKAEERTIPNMDYMITGYYVLGSFFYIQEVELNGN